MTVLILGGTGEARELASALVAQGVPVISSLAGRVARPRLPEGEVRIGGFGGPDGLAEWLAAREIDAVVDATHPFAERISASATTACAIRDVPLLRLERPGWSETSEDRWVWVDDLPEAARALPGLGSRVFLTTGRQGLSAFAGLDGLWFLVRCVDPPEVPLPRGHELLLDRGPYSVEGELELIDRHQLDVVVTKDSGGPLTEAKLVAARQRCLPVVVVRRPRRAAAHAVADVPAALAWGREPARIRDDAVRTLLVIGIGAGNPDHLTLEAIRALNEVDAVFIVTKGDDKRELEDLRRELCDRHIERHDVRTVEIADPPRDRAAAAYAEAVEDWRQRRAGAFASAIRDELGLDDSGALLVWGDPAFYDSTLPIVEDIIERGELELAYRVIPGISSLQSLAASHRVTLTRVGRPLQITTGRRVADGAHDDDDDILVMLDAGLAFRRFGDCSFDIYWGAYLGTADEILISGRVEDVSAQIERVRADARARKGWIMDTYLLRRRG